MQRKKPDKLNFAMPTSNNDYYELMKGPKLSTLPQNMNESLFCKYASSIIQVVSQDKLDFSCSGGVAQQYKNAIFEISEVNDLKGEGVGKGNSFYQESNNYNNIAAKMKKKGGNRKLLSYNFSNLTLLNEAGNRIFKKCMKNCFDLIRYWSNEQPNSDYNKTKKEIKRSSFHSGYTTSTSNEQKIGKKQSKKLTQQKKKDIYREGAHQIKGFLQFKILLVVSQAFNNISSHATKFTVAFNKTPFGVSQVSTIKNEPLQNFYLTEYSHDHQMSIAKEMLPSMSESLIYTVDKNFAFTEVQVACTPQRSPVSNNINNSKSPFANLKMPKNINHESIVQPYRPKQFKLPPKSVPIKEKATTALSKPLKFTEVVQRRYLTIRTNIYQLPLLSKNELQMQQSKGIKQLSILQDQLNRSEPQTCHYNDTILLQLAQADYLFKPKPNNHKNIQSSKKSSKNYYLQKMDKSQSDKLSTTNDLQDQDNKKFFISNIGQNVKEQKKQAKIKEYYPNKNISSLKADKNKMTSNIDYERKAMEPIKSVQPITNATYKSQQKSQKVVRFDESVVNQFQLYQEKKKDHLIINKSQARAQQNKPIYFKENLDKKQQKTIRSISKSNAVVQSPRRQSPRVQIYSPPIQHQVKLQSKPIPKNNQKYYANNPYCYPTPQHQRPTSPKIVINDPKTNGVPLKHQNVYQMAQGVPYMKQPAYPQKIVNPAVKQNDKTNGHQQQQQIRVEGNGKISPGKVVNPNYLINSHEKRQNPLITTPSHLKKDEKKPNFYSPQIGKEVYMQSPQKYIQIEPQKIHTPNINNNLRRMHTQQQYFIKQNNHQPQLRAINFNNNYYTNGPQTTRQIPIINQVNRNVFQQEQTQRKQIRIERPPSNRQSIEKANIFSNYSPLESQLQYQQRSNNFSKNSSELSRPKSMNQKIFITLRKDK